MQPLSQSSEYAIRALTLLAVRRGEGYQLVREMAPAMEVPEPFLAKLLQPLVGRGFVESQRGRGGGFRLAKEPAEIDLFSVVDVHTPLGGARRCILGQSECTDERACPMHEYWKGASEAWRTRLLSTTLEDLVRFRQERPGCGYPCPAED